MTDTHRLHCPNHGDLGPAKSEAEAQQLLSRHSRVYACPRKSLSYRAVDTDVDRGDGPRTDGGTRPEGIEGDLGTCDRCNISDAEIPIVTVVNGRERKEWVCPGCEDDAREDEKPPVVSSTETDR